MHGEGGSCNSDRREAYNNNKNHINKCGERERFRVSLSLMIVASFDPSIINFFTTKIMTKVK